MLRQSTRRHHHHRHGFYGPWWLDRGDFPFWDNWGRHGPGGLAEAAGADGMAPPEPADRSHFQTARRPKPPLPALRHRHDGSTLVGLLAMVFGLAWLAAGTQILQVSIEGVLAVALMVLGATMVVTARTDWALSRRSWPVMAGAALVVALVLSSASPSLGGGLRNLQIGSRTVAPANWVDLPTHVQAGVGRTEVIVPAIDQAAKSRTLTIDGAVGSLVIRLPPLLSVQIDGRVGLGNVAVNGRSVASGFRQSFSQRLPMAATGDPALILHVNAGIEGVEIFGAGPTNPTFAPDPTVPPPPPAP